MKVVTAHHCNHMFAIDVILLIYGK